MLFPLVRSANALHVRGPTVIKDSRDPEIGPLLRRGVAFRNFEWFLRGS
jgi:hypothetical protein